MALHVLAPRLYPLLTATAAATLFDASVWSGGVPRVVRTLLERHLFDLAARDATLLKDDPVHPRVREAFRKHGYPLAEGSCVTRMAPQKWLITSAHSLFVVRRDTDRCVVSGAPCPALARAVLGVSTVLDQCRYEYPRRLRDTLFVWTATLRKRWLDRPQTLMVNLGAGRWYEQGWKVLDHSGSWYRYPKLFVDYPFDLTSMQPLPFHDDSVRLFYCEHVLEHFSDALCGHVCREMYRSLRPGAGLRIVVPDADLLYERYARRDERFFAPWMTRYNATLTEAFVTLFAYQRTPLDESDVERNFATLAKEEFYDRYTRGLSYDYRYAGEHINWFTCQKLTAMLHVAGFSTVARSGPQQSRFVEMRGRCFDTRPSYSLHIDAVK